MAEVLLGDDGCGYDLARRLDDIGAWRAWLGDSVYATFSPCLASPSAWEAFMSSSTSESTAAVTGTFPNVKSAPMTRIHLQLRVRALLYDKAAAALFICSHSASRPTLASLNSTYLQLHGGDVYYSLEPEAWDDAPYTELSAAPSQMQSKTQPQQTSVVSSSKMNGSSFGRKTSSGAFNELDSENVKQKDKHEFLPDLWYDQFIERNKMNRYLKFPFAEYESLKRTPEGMASYLKYLSMHKRRRLVFKDDQSMDVTASGGDNGSGRYPGMAEDEAFLIPEMMFPLNCVPDGILLPMKKQEDHRKVHLQAPLDSLPHLVTPSRAMIERFGIRPEYLRVEFGRNKVRGKSGVEGNTKLLTHEQALQKSQKTVALVLTTTGLEGGSEVAIGVLSQFLGNHVSKLGRILKLLTDTYKNQFNSTELIKMFLKTTGIDNVAALSDYMKNNRTSSHHGQQLHSLRVQQSPHLLQAPQHMRPMLPQANLRSQSITFQQQQQMQLRQQQLRLLQQQQQSQMHVSPLQQHHMQIQAQKQQQQIQTQGQQQQQIQTHGQQQQQQMPMQGQQQPQQMQIQGQLPQSQQLPMQGQQQTQVQMQGQQQTQVQLQGQQQHTQQMQVQGQQPNQLMQIQGQQQTSQQMQTIQHQQQQMQMQMQQQQQQKLQNQQPQMQLQQQQQQQQKVQQQQQQQQVQMQQHQHQQMQIKQQHHHHQQPVQVPQQQLIPMQQQLQQQQIPVQQQPVQQQQQMQNLQMLQQMRQRQIAAARGSGLATEKDRTMAEVKNENTTDSSVMEGSFGNNVTRQQLQFRQQQLAMASSQQQQQPGKQFKQYTSVQSPQLQSQGSYGARTPPMKVEGFQELMGGDSASRQDSEERKLTSP